MENQANQNSTVNDVYSVDLNCDVGESTGSQIVGNDQVLIPLVSSANIACGGHGGDIKYVKPHGALYHCCNVDASAAQAVVELAQAFDPSLSMMGQAGTEFERICDQMNVHFIREAFADRRYLKNGRLVPRSQPEAVIRDPTAAGLQAVSIVLQAKVTIDSNHEAEVIGDSICVSRNEATQENCIDC